MQTTWERLLIKRSVNTSSDTSNTCLNSLADKCRGIEARAFQAIDASEIELKPCEIARKIHHPKKPTRGQYTTVRGVCAKLLQKGLVVQPYPGTYCNKITHTVRFVPLCVHNVTLKAFVCQSLKSWQADEFVGGVKIHVCFGKERKQVSGYIACDVGGMSHDCCRFALNRWFEIVEGRLGYCLQDLVLQTVEFNKDYHGRRIDGFQCVTKSDLYGIIDRTYQKENDVIRRERKLTQPMSINKFEAEIRRGLDEIGKAQDRYEMHAEIRENTEALKFTNSRLLEIERQTQALSKRAVSEAVLRDDLRQLVEALQPLRQFVDLVAFKDPMRIAEGQRRMQEYLS